MTIKEKLIRIGDFEVTQGHKNAIMEVLDSNRLTEGSKVKALEEVMRNYLDVKHAIMVTNGTVALQLVGQYIQHKLGKKNPTIIVPALTFPATINAFEILGFEIILCDVGEDMQIDLSTLHERYKIKADAIVPVHLMGDTVDMSALLKEAEYYHWLVIEDTAEAFGALCGERKAGTIGDFGTFSFYVSHNIIAGELGMVVTNDDDAAVILRSMKNHGRAGDSMKFLHKYVGSNYKTTEFCAAIALENMKTVNKTLNTRRDNSAYFMNKISNPDLQPFQVHTGFSPLGYPIRCFNENDRNAYCKLLNDNNIETREMFPCLANQEAYTEKFKNKKFPVSNILEKNIFYIGCHQYLTDEDKKKIVDVLNKGIKK